MNLSKIEQLIIESNPKEIKWVTLERIAQITTGEHIDISDILSVGDYPAYLGALRIARYHNQFNTEANTIIIQSTGPKAGYVNFIATEFWAGPFCYIIKLTTNKINNRFLYYYLKTKEEDLSNMKTSNRFAIISKNKLQKFFIPILPLKLQEQIVQSLDNMNVVGALLEEEVKAWKEEQDKHAKKIFATIWERTI